MNSDTCQCIFRYMSMYLNSDTWHVSTFHWGRCQSKSVWSCIVFICEIAVRVCGCVMHHIHCSNSSNTRNVSVWVCNYVICALAMNNSNLQTITTSTYPSNPHHLHLLFKPSPPPPTLQTIMTCTYLSNPHHLHLPFKLSPPAPTLQTLTTHPKIQTPSLEGDTSAIWTKSSVMIWVIS